MEVVGLYMNIHTYPNHIVEYAHAPEDQVKSGNTSTVPVQERGLLFFRLIDRSVNSEIKAI